MPSVLIGRTGGFQPDVLLDFTKAFYRKDGLIGSIAAIGGTTVGAPSITSAGLLCGSGEYISVPYDVTGDFVVVADFAAITAGVVAYYLHPSSKGEYVGWSGLSPTVTAASEGFGLGRVDAVSPTSTKAAFGWQGNFFKASFMGSTVTSRNNFAPPTISGSSSLLCGNSGGASQANGRVRSVAIFKGAFTDLDFAAFSTP